MPGVYHKRMRLRFLSLATLLLAQPVPAQPQAILPLSEVRAGQHATGRTVFSGNKVEEFQVEILGILENLGPKQNIILGKLSGGPLEKTGVMQGMSGSPVYLNGRLMGAVALAFPFAKEAIAGIRPIEEMLTVESSAITERLEAARPVTLGETRLVDIATPVSFSGFTRGTLDHFAPMLRDLGLDPRQGIAGGAPVKSTGPVKPLQPGEMISVQLVSGDLSVGADGTVTHVDGNKVYAFGHRFMGLGDAEMPFARSEVITLLANVSTSFKISSAKQWIGSILAYRNAAVSGEIGRKADLVPVTVNVKNLSRPGSSRNYRMNVIRDRFLSPLLLQMAVYSAIDGTERTLGSATVHISGKVNMSSGAPILIDNQYAADFGAPAQASLAAVLPLSFILQSKLPNWKPLSMEFNIEARESREAWQLDRFYARRNTYKPGETVEFDAIFRKEDGTEIRKLITYPIPEGVNTGTLYASLSDGATANGIENRLHFGSAPRTREQALKFLTAQRKNTSAWVRIWRADMSFDIGGEAMPALPSSVALLFAKSQSSQASLQPGRPSKLAEFETPLGEVLTAVSRTVQIEIKP